MWHKFWLIKNKKDPPLMFDPPSFWNPHSFWYFDHSSVIYGLETSKKWGVSPRPTQNPFNHWTGV